MVCARHRHPPGLGPDPPIHVMARQIMAWQNASATSERANHDGKDRDEGRPEVSDGNREKAP